MENSSILRLPTLPATQLFNSVSGEGYHETGPCPVSFDLHSTTGTPGGFQHGRDYESCLHCQLTNW
jgi:hypothetical protein